MWPFLLFIIELWLTIQQQFVRVITKVNPCCKALSNFFSEHFCCSFPLVPLLNVLYCVSGCLKPLSSSYVIGAFSSPHHVSAVHHCQTGDNNDNNTRREKKKLHFPRVPLCLVALGWGASLIQKSIQFCCIDSQPPTGRKRPRRRALIDGAASFRHRCQHRNIDCWLKPKSIKLTQTAPAPSVFLWPSCDFSHEKLTWRHRSPFVNMWINECVITGLLTRHRLHDSSGSCCLLI